MSKTSQSNTYHVKLHVKILIRVLFLIFAFIFRIKKKLPAEVKQIQSGYLLLSNHAGFWDPFVVGIFLPKFTQFVSSDAAFRSRLLRFFLTRFGTIPKKKNIRDTKVIRDIVAVIKQGGNVGIFPSGSRSWSGVNLPFDIAIVKLIKLLKVPVIVSVMKGMNLFNPRWSKKIRYTRIEVEYKLLADHNQIQTLDEETIFAKLNALIFHDEVEYQRHKMNKIYSRHKAEYINHALYVCPDCYAIDSFRAKGNNFRCCKCNYDIHINKYGFFERITDGKLYFDNIRDWYNWEEKWMIKYVYEKFDNQCNNIIFEDENSSIFYADLGFDLNFIGKADLRLFIDRIEVGFLDAGKLKVLDFNCLQTINPQLNERLEIFSKDGVYRVVGGRHGVSALKWEVAVNAIWKKLGQEAKLSAYIPQ